MAGRNKLIINKLLNCIECSFEVRDVIKIRTFSPNLVKNLSKSRSPKATLPLGQINVQQNSIIFELQIWTNCFCYVWRSNIGTDYKVSRSFHNLTPCGGSHGKTVLPTINSNAKFNHNICKSCGSIIHVCPFPIKLRCIHPIAASFNIREGCNFGPYQICESFADCQSCHSLRVQQTLDRLLPNSTSTSGEVSISLSNNCNICKSNLQGAYSLLLSHEASYTSVYLCGQETL
uniref:Uncharacterized protein n=1 Tax=Opuntia streptacantha TaxID=393608 RepID=A0A7C9AQI3_OPUST